MKKSTLTKILQLFSFLILPLGLFAQNASITGKVVDKNSEPLIGVNLMIKGTTIGTISDLDGNFTIHNVPNKQVEVVASFIGYTNLTKQVDLTNAKIATLNFTLLEDIAELSEVVVIGYGTQKKSDLTSAVASVSASDLEQSRAANIQEALQGRAAGVQVSSNTGAPGSNVSVKIRGITSINGTDPIWVIDGVVSDPNSVNAADIESMEILKDASSAAIYGANAGSGVVLVTTKKGKAGDTKVTFNSYWGVQNVTKTIDVANGPDFIRMLHEYETLAKYPSRKYFSLEPDTFQTYNYQDKIFREAFVQNYDLGVSGGTEKSTFYMGIGYLDQEGIVKKTGYNKISVRINGEHKANKWLKVGLNSSYTRQETEGFEEWELKNEYANPILQALTYHSFVEPYGDKVTDSEYDKGWSYTPLGNTQNPLSTVELKNHKTTTHNATATAFGIITLVEGLNIESRLTGNASFNSNYNFEPIFYITGSLQNTNSSITRGTGYYQGWTFQNLITYNKTLFDVHNISLLAGYESGYGKSEVSSGIRYDLINQTPEMWYFDASTNNTIIGQFPTGSASETSGYSYLGRAGYDYKGIVLGQFNIRRDASSLFGPNNRIGVFPSFSVGFKFTELDIVHNTLPFMNFGKLRYGWGKVGNNCIPPYQYFSTVAYERVYGYSFSNTATSSLGAAPNLFVNKAVHWEDVVTSNLGLDFGFLNNRLSASIDYFERHNIGMLMIVESAWLAGWIVENPYQEGGVSDPFKNVGEFNNKGIEISAGWKEQLGRLNYGANLNLSFIKTTVGDISPDTIYQGTTKGVSNYLTRTIDGQYFEPFYGYVTDGLFRLSDMPNEDGIVTNQPYTINPDGEIIYAQPYAQPGDFRYKDINGDGKINDSDKVSLGSPYPKITYAFNFFADYELPRNWGALDCKVFFQGSYGNKVFNATKFYLYNTDGAFNWSEEYAKNHYSVELYDRNDVLVSTANDDAKYPRIDPLGVNGNFTNISDFYVEDASYLRLKNLEIGYTVA
ncbi:MAG: SusC/RagA family TonB-linked outer membrane protein, partial [Salinivirgaceae bacterium]|nr:SusC/RagA family TonB-linked outer membrane protein [Salinivirgaceae bacterium]